MRIKAIMLALTGALLLAACGAQGTYYEKTPQQARSALRSAVLPFHVLGSMAKGSRVTQPDENTLVTAILGPDQSELMRFVTTITPDGSGSRVAVEVRPPEGRNKDRAGKAMGSNGFAMALMDKLAQEHVAAAMEGRPFNMMFASGPMAGGMVAANPEMQAQINQANQGAEDMNRAMQNSGGDDGFGSENDAEGGSVE